MKKSARQLARDLNVSDRVLNVILRNKGYQSGEPGNYEPTSKGLPFVEEHENSHGNGGYSNMNKSEIIRRWDDSIMDEPDMVITDEDISEAYEYLSERNRLQREKRKADSEAYWAEHSPSSCNNDADSLEEDSADTDIIYAIVAGVIALGAAVRWVAPKAKNLWNEKVAPRIDTLTKKEECPICSGTMRYSKKQNCWTCKECGATKQQEEISTAK